MYLAVEINSLSPSQSQLVVSINNNIISYHHITNICYGAINQSSSAPHITDR